LDRELDAEIEIARAREREHCHTRGVAFRFERQILHDALDRGDAHAGFRHSTRLHAIADRLHAVSEHIEADSDVADAGGSECGGEISRAFHSRGHAQSFAPRYAQTRSKSANTPAAVTSGPAPGPWTTSGFWL